MSFDSDVLPIIALLTIICPYVSKLESGSLLACASVVVVAVAQKGFVRKKTDNH